MEKEELIKLIQEKFNEFKLKEDKLLNILNQKSIPKIKNQISNDLKNIDFEVEVIGNDIYARDKRYDIIAFQLMFVIGRNIAYEISNFKKKCQLHITDKIDNEIYRDFNTRFFNGFVNQTALIFNWQEKNIDELREMLQVLTENVECLDKRLNRLVNIDVNEIKIEYMWDQVSIIYDNFIDAYNQNIRYFLQ